MPAAYLVVRAVVADPGDRAAFDTWYRTEHLPDALRAFKAKSAMRGWSSADPSVHTAFYRFDTATEAHAASRGDAIRPLIAEFDRNWGTRVARARDILELADELPG